MRARIWRAGGRSVTSSAEATTGDGSGGWGGSCHQFSRGLELGRIWRLGRPFVPPVRQRPRTGRDLAAGATVGPLVRKGASNWARSTARTGSGRLAALPSQRSRRRGRSGAGRLPAWKRQRPPDHHPASCGSDAGKHGHVEIKPLRRVDSCVCQRLSDNEEHRRPVRQVVAPTLANMVTSTTPPLTGTSAGAKATTNGTDHPLRQVSLRRQAWSRRRLRRVNGTDTPLRQVVRSDAGKGNTDHEV